MDARGSSAVLLPRRTSDHRRTAATYVDARLRPVYALAESCRYEVGHAHQVTRLALRLFDELADVHRLDERSRFHLTAAALLHDIGYIDGAPGHHKSSLRLIARSPLLPWGERQRLIVGSIARYHRKALPHRSHAHYVALSEADQRDVCALAGIVRLADGLDRGHRSVVRDLTCDANARRVTIACLTSRSAEIQMRSAAGKADLLRASLDRDVLVECEMM